MDEACYNDVLSLIPVAAAVELWVASKACNMFSRNLCPHLGWVTGRLSVCCTCFLLGSARAHCTAHVPQSPVSRAAAAPPKRPSPCLPCCSGAGLRYCGLKYANAEAKCIDKVLSLIQPDAACAAKSTANYTCSEQCKSEFGKVDWTAICYDSLAAYFKIRKLPDFL